MRIRLDIAYDGTHFRGWAKQRDLRTVEGTIEAAIQRVLRLAEPVRMIVAGRTDTGVHATGQVAHMDVEPSRWAMLSDSRRGSGDSESMFLHRVRGVLGSYADSAVTGARVAPEGFDARFSAVWRRYEYRIGDRISGYDPIERLRTTTVRRVLDIDAMNEAASTLRGLHDFAAYCRPRAGATTIRTLLDFEWRRDERGIVVAHVRADAFCHSMVRALVGACVAVGEGRLDVADVARLRDEKERTNAFSVQAARGLTLVEVGYPSEEQLALRAEQTRARREL